MFNLLQKLPRWKKRLAASDIDALVERVNVLSRIAGIGGTKVYTGPTGVHIKGGGGEGGTKAKMYEVQSAATGDGVYNCYEQLVDATDWTSTTEVDKLVDKDATSVAVFNLMENYCYTPGYSDACRVGDRFIGWSSTDDEGNVRIVGVPITGNVFRFGYTQEAAQADEQISVKLLNYKFVEVGSAFDVTCLIQGGTALNAAIPRLTLSTTIPIVNMCGYWYCTTVFQASEDCSCTP